MQSSTNGRGEMARGAVSPGAQNGASPATSIAAFFESFVLTEPRAYALRGAGAQDHVRRLLSRLGAPHHDLPCMHIAGSKGKGTTALFVESILQAAGYTTGTFTSPHLQRWTERFRIHGREMDAAALLALIERVRPHANALAAQMPADPPSFFDVMTATALLAMHDAGADFGIIEAGIGARMDATRVVHSAVTCITNVELEHTDKLGRNVADIAAQKAGVIKAGAPLVTGALPASAARVVDEQARILGVGVSRLGRDFHLTARCDRRGGMALKIRSDGLAMRARLATPALHLARCAALAVRCVQSLELLSLGELRDAVTTGLPATHLPGRVEVLSRTPLIVVDAAHTGASARALAATLPRLGAGPFSFVISMSPDKRLAEVLAPLRALSVRFTFTCAEPTRSLDATALARAARAHLPGCAIDIEADPARAIESARACLQPGEGLCATGSVYMAGIARTVLHATTTRNTACTQTCQEGSGHRSSPG